MESKTCAGCRGMVYCREEERDTWQRIGIPIGGEAAEQLNERLETREKDIYKTASLGK